MRAPKPYWKQSHKAWYVNIKGKPIRLGTDEEAAHQKYHAIMAVGQVVTPTTTVAGLLGQFLEWCRDNQGQGTYTFYSGPLVSFGEHVGIRLTIGDLKARHVLDWIAERYPDAGNNTKHNAVRAVKRPFNWACERGDLAESPLRFMRNPFPAERRETYIDSSQYNSVLAAIRDDEFRDFVQFMRETGCRPKEVALAEARHFDRDSKVLDFPKAESKGKHERRVILLDGLSLEIIERLALKHPEGPLFRNARGEAWTKNAVVQRFTHIQGRVKFPVTAYTIRHAWATDALTRNVPIQYVAQIMGHKNLKMLMEVYNHLHRKGDELRAAMRVAQGREEAMPDVAERRRA